MIYPVLLKYAFSVGVVGETAVLVAASSQSTTIDTTAVWVAALGFGGLIVTSIMTYVSQRSAATDARIAAAESRLAQTDQVKQVGEIHTLVNSKATEQSEIIRKLTEEVARLNATALHKAEMAPSIVGAVVPVAAATPQPSLLVPTPGAPAAMGTGAVQVSVPVHLVDQSKPVDVKVIEDEPNAKKE